MRKARPAARQGTQKKSRLHIVKTGVLVKVKKLSVCKSLDIVVLNS